MKKLLLFISCILLGEARGQVNLDAAVPVGVSDKMYRSVENNEIAYFFPSYLSVTSTEVRPSKKFVDLRMSYDYENAALTRLTDLAKASGIRSDRIRLLRPLSYEVNLGIDIDEMFNAQVRIMADNPLEASSTVNLRLAKIRHLFAYDTADQVRDLTKAGANAHVADLVYSFNAVVQGQPFKGKTRVPIMTNGIEQNFTSGVRHENVPSVLIESQALTVTPDLVFDSNRSCWNNVKAGEICLK